MDARLTLNLDKEVIEQAKRYAERRGLSLSRVVESYFLRLVQSEEPPREKLTGVVAELAGVLKGAEIGDPRRVRCDVRRRKGANCESHRQRSEGW
ncbi:MAG TPA: DUF6364 family protein [Thermoanaerobaculia bacterium]|nr:DUF6364 family protein [Thermoanaerobaculia bacterium]